MIKGIQAGKGLRAVGAMSGTSLDGVDVAEVITDGQEIFGFWCDGISEL